MSAAGVIVPGGAPAVLPTVVDVTLGRVRLLVSGRDGGVSSGAFATANVGALVGDDPVAVAANRAALERTAGLGPGGLRFLHQVHGDRVVEVAAATGDEPRADGGLATHPGTGVAVTAADCLPLLLADPGGPRAAAVHVGRVGLTLDIAGKAVAALRAAGADQVAAVLGPAVCGLCYEVPAAMRDEVAAAAPGSASTTRHGTAAVDIRAGVLVQLTRAGVSAVTSVDICTVEDARLFSHRRDRATGRFAGVAAILP